MPLTSGATNNPGKQWVVSIPVASSLTLAMLSFYMQNNQWWQVVYSCVMCVIINVYINFNLLICPQKHKLSKISVHLIHMYVCQVPWCNGGPLWEQCRWRRDSITVSWYHVKFMWCEIMKWLSKTIVYWNVFISWPEVCRLSESSSCLTGCSSIIAWL